METNLGNRINDTRMETAENNGRMGGLKKKLEKRAEEYKKKNCT